MAGILEHIETGLVSLLNGLESFEHTQPMGGTLPSHSGGGDSMFSGTAQGSGLPSQLDHLLQDGSQR